VGASPTLRSLQPEAAGAGMEETKCLKPSDSGKTPLFRSAIGKTCTLTEKAMNRIDAYRMIRRRSPGPG
jgi:hypothetical protein